MYRSGGESPPNSGGRLTAAILQPESYSRIRNMKPNLKHASLDKIDSLNEVSIGLAATVCMSVTILLVLMPLFHLTTMPWMRSWEGSGMTMLRLKYGLADQGLYTEHVYVNLIVDSLEPTALTMASKEALRTLTKRHVEETYGSIIMDSDFELAMSDVPMAAIEDSPKTSLRRRLFGEIESKPALRMSLRVCALRQGGMHRDAVALVNHLNERENRMEREMEMDLTGDSSVRTVSRGTLVVHASGPWTLHRTTDNVFQAADDNENGLLEFNEFYTLVKGFTDEDVALEEARHAFAGLDMNNDGVLERAEMDEAFGYSDLFHHSDSSFGSASLPTTTITTTTTQPPVPVAGTTVTQGLTTTTAMVTAKPVVILPQTTSKPQQVGPVYASVELVLDAIPWKTLDDKDRKGFAEAFRNDLAYASGTLSSEVYDVDHDDRHGCVNLGERLEGSLFIVGCLKVPDGASEADIQSVVTSGTEINKIVRDFRAVDSNLVVGMHDVKVSVYSLKSCSMILDTATKNVDEFCEVPTTTTTTTYPMGIVSMGWFLEKMGTTEEDEPRDIFAFLDENMNEFADWEEFLDVTMDGKQMRQALNKVEATSMFRFLDHNKDGRVEALEFLEAYNRAKASGWGDKELHAGPVSIDDYREALGHTPEFTKVGNGLCRTPGKAMPANFRDPDGHTQEQCQAICISHPNCGAFAFKADGVCRIYPTGHRYWDTTAMTDVQCFAKHMSSEAKFDLIRVHVVMSGDFNEDIATSTAGEKELASVVAYEVGIPHEDVRSNTGTRGECAFDERGSAKVGFRSLQAVCFLNIDVGETLPDVAAVLAAPSTKKKIALNLHNAVPNMPLLTEDDFQIQAEGSSAMFRTADLNEDGRVSRGELQAASQDWAKPLSEEAVPFAVKGLDFDQDGVLSPNEFEAVSAKDFYKVTLRAAPAGA
eukprot:CAMPEP_0206463046 /NCGR_PEP_ID=MMETSP0324_2-20121206/26354_1 /ASSEMBLY_ACC=CAM_ASM_000836 /TAXON_ID=2866 /ORGANISM="Crypthecodinium cohnii, Strain Seligo" /LENGTH=932 /DNA_ID=CAMNT_0053935345 /DNA_START=121 /DNA_END=2919 /DNA_ORIENTATION=+